MLQAASGCASDRDLRQEHPPRSPAPEECLPAGMKDGGSSSQRRLGWAGREAPGGDRAQLPWQAGSTPVGAVTRRERGDIVASVPPTTLFSGTQRAWEICPHLPRLCSGRWENAHGSTWGGGWGS